MQKLINVLAVLSFVGTASIIGGGVYIYIQKDALIENAKEKVKPKQQQKQLLVLSLVWLMLQYLSYLKLQVPHSHRYHE